MSEGTLTNTIDGQAQLKSLQPQVEAVELTSTNLPLTNLIRLCTVISSLMPLIKQEAPAAAAKVADETLRPQLMAAVERLSPVTDALFFAEGRRLEQIEVQSQTQTVNELNERYTQARDLRRLGFVWLRVLRAMGKISEEELRALEIGRGRVDTASDLQGMALHLRAHWSTLEPLQASQPDPQQRLTPARLDTMAKLGTWLINNLASTSNDTANDDTDWRDQTARLAHILQEDYTLVRACLLFHLDLEERSEEAAPLQRFLALGR